MSICFRRPAQPPCWAVDAPWLQAAQPVTLNAGESAAITLTLTAPAINPLPIYRATVLLDSPELPALVMLPVTMLTAPLAFQALLPLVTQP